MAAITLYVPCFNGASFLERCIEGIRLQTRAPDRLVLVDDGSTDGTADVARSLGFEVISHAKNSGLGAARNTALRACNTELIASLDADCVAHPRWLERLESALSRERAAGVGGMLIETNNLALADRWRTHHMRQHWGPDPLQNPPFLFGNNNLFHKASLIAAGGYNERYRTNFEDVAMSRALYSAGFTLYYDPSASVQHLRSDSIGSVVRTNWRWRAADHDGGTSVSTLVRSLWLQRSRELAGFLRCDMRNADLAGGLLSLAAVGYCIAADVEHTFNHYKRAYRGA